MQDITTNMKRLKNELALRLALRLQLLWGAFVAHTRRLRTETGAAAVEYVGLVVIAALLIGFIVTAIKPVEQAVTDAVNDVIGK